MSDALIVTFQSQLSIVMETILKSAMFEITKLVEDSFMEEVGHAKQEVELLMRRLQFYESKLKERERRVCCVDCGKTPSSGEKRAEQPAEAHPGADTLCFSLSLREQSGKRPPFSEVWRSAEGLDSCPPPETHTQPHAPTHAQTQAPAQAQTHTQAHVLTQKKTDTPEQSRKQDSVTNTSVQLPQYVLQKLLPNPAVTGNHEHCSSSKPRESHQHKTPGIDFIPSNEIDLTQSNRLMQSIAEKDVAAELSCSPPSPAMKLECEPDLLPIKEEEEMLPVWDCTDDSGPAESELNRRDLGGPWNHEETQLAQMPPGNPPTELDKVHPTSRQRTFSVVAREILTQFQVWQRACYSRNIEWGPITAKIVSALPYLSGKETEVIVRCTKMLHNRRDYLRRRAKDAFLERNTFPVAQRYLVQLQRGDLIQHMNL
uniref:Si:ch73-109d9.1 n=1 Tax=Astyanax mexicanus TaxID=7994 RepID=A0A8B9LIW1_ASTMX